MEFKKKHNLFVNYSCQKIKLIILVINKLILILIYNNSLIIIWLNLVNNNNYNYMFLEN